MIFFWGVGQGPLASTRVFLASRPGSHAPPALSGGGAGEARWGGAKMDFGFFLSLFLDFDYFVICVAMCAISCRSSLKMLCTILRVESAGGKLETCALLFRLVLENGDIRCLGMTIPKAPLPIYSREW